MNKFLPMATRRGCLVAVVLVVGLRLCAASGGMSEYTSRTWLIEEGLPHNIVHALAQTPDGYLWVGTREGLARFDGIRFTELEFPGAIGHPSIYCLMVGRNGWLWIGTENAGLFYLHDGHLERHPIANGFRFDRITALEETADGTIWIGEVAGLAGLKDGRLKFPLGQDSQHPTWALGTNAAGALWVADREVECLQGDKVTLVYSNLPAMAPHSMRKILCDHAGTLWIGGMKGLSHLQDGRFVHYPNAETIGEMVHTICEDREGNLWVGTYAGLRLFKNGQFTDKGLERVTPTRVYSVFEDREGALWVGSEDGLTRLVRKRFRNYTTDDGLSRDVVAAVCAGQDGSIWLGSTGGGLNRLKDDTVTIYTRTNGLSSDFILGIYEDPQGGLWAGANYEAPLNVLKDGKFTYYDSDQGLDNRSVTCIQQDSRGNMWCGTRRGLYCLTQGRFTQYTTGDGLRNGKINALGLSADGTLWIGTDAGLNTWSNSVLASVATNVPEVQQPVLCFYEDCERIMWVGLHGGLARFHQGQIAVYTRRQGLLNDSIYGIVEDDHRQLWINSNKGVFRLRKAELEDVSRGLRSSFDCFPYDKEDGVIGGGQQLDATPAACRGKDGRLWFRTAHGVAVVDPNKVARNEMPPPVRIEEVVANGRQVPAVNMLAATQLPSPDRLGEPAFRIPPGRGELEIHYTALSLCAPEKNRFKYRLEGADTEWVEAGRGRYASYRNLAPGPYRFRVIACNNDGLWNETGALLSLTLQPHYWQTWWFKGLLSLAGATVALGVAWEVVRLRVRRQVEHQRAVEGERARIARDIHDDLGARLTEVMFLSELARQNTADAVQVDAQIERISHAVRDITQNVNALIWTVNPTNDSVDKLVAYICKYAEKFLSATSLRYRLNAPVDFPQTPLSSDTRHNIFLVVKEALNNVVRHAAATEVRLGIQAGASLSIAVQDNGKGFSLGNGAPSGNGLRNMQHRAARIGARFTVSSQPGEGTLVQLEVPLKNHSTP